jgi:lysozyme family protein
MQANETVALDLIIQWEGPEVNVSETEPGGISKYGVSLQTYADFMKKTGQPAPSANTIADLTELQARSFYQTEFLPAINFDNLPSGIDVRLADISINLGITGAINLLETTLMQYPLTNTITPSLLTTLNTYDPKSIVLALSAGWIANKHTSKNWATDGHGWSNRNISVTQECLKLVGGTVAANT